METAPALPAYEAIFTSGRPQAMTVRTLKAGVRPDRTVRAAGKRPARLFGDLSIADASDKVASAPQTAAGLQPHYVMAVMKTFLRRQLRRGSTCRALPACMCVRVSLSLDVRLQRTCCVNMSSNALFCGPSSGPCVGGPTTQTVAHAARRQHGVPYGERGWAGQPNCAPSPPAPPGRASNTYTCA